MLYVDKESTFCCWKDSVCEVLDEELCLWYLWFYHVCLFSFLLHSFFGVLYLNLFSLLICLFFSIPVISFIFVIRHWDCSFKWPSPFLHALFGRKLRNMWSRNLCSARRYCADLSWKQHINAFGDGPRCYNTTLRVRCAHRCNSGMNVMG